MVNETATTKQRRLKTQEEMQHISESDITETHKISFFVLAKVGLFVNRRRKHSFTFENIELNFF
jgi:hypothetical protein